jgi:hypothetical protein
MTDLLCRPSLTAAGVPSGRSGPTFPEVRTMGPDDRRVGSRHRLQDLPPGQPRRKAMDEVRRGARSVRVHPQISTCTVKPADLVSLQVSGGRPSLVAAPCRPQGNKFRRAPEGLGDATLKRRVVTEMPVSHPKTRNELTRMPVPDNSGNGCGRSFSRLAYVAGLHVASLACVRSMATR